MICECIQFTNNNASCFLALVKVNLKKIAKNIKKK